MATQEWGNQKRKTLDQLFGVKERVDQDHPEVIARSKMTHDEEIDYITKKYFVPKKNADRNSTQPECQQPNKNS